MLTAKGRLKKTLSDEVGHLTVGEGEKSSLSQIGLKIKLTFNAFFAFVFMTSDGPWEPWSPGLEDCDWGSDKLTVDFELVKYLLL